MKIQRSATCIQHLQVSNFLDKNQFHKRSLRHSYLNTNIAKLITVALISFTLLNQVEAQSTNDTKPQEGDKNPYGTEGHELAFRDEKAKYTEQQKKELIEKYGNGKLKIQLDSIDPEGGPITGNTRVLVRGGPFKDLEAIYPRPKCKFGKHDLVVDATYVLCATRPTKIEDNEPRHRHMNDTCLQCDNNEETSEAEIVPFTVSLTGDFSDVGNSLPFRYYQPTRVYGIKPRYGPKDGETFVEVWGENFLNFDENTRCNFGSKSVKAHYVSSTYMTCIAPTSDVVVKPIPFSISLNKQQNSKDDINYWYYNWPQISEIVPNYGPDSGNHKILLKGNNFDPFLETNGAINNTNDTFVEFEGIGKVHARVINSTKVELYTPPNFIFDDVTVELTLNDQQYTDDNNKYHYYRPPQVFDIDPREGPTKGGTHVMVFGNKFKDSKNITCKFGDKITNGTFINENKIKCVSPPVEKPGYVPLTISYEGERYSSDTVKYLYYENPEIQSIVPTCGPVTGYTQVTVFGKNFIDMGFGKVKCIFNDTIQMNATLMEPDIIKCDSPALPPNQWYSDHGAPFYFIKITLNGKQFTEKKIKFTYYIDPSIQSITPNKGPLRGGTISELVGKGFAQEGACNVTVRYGALTQNITDHNDTLIITRSPIAKIPDAVVVSIALNGQQFINDKTLHYRDYENTFTYYQDVYILDYSPKAGPSSGKTKIRVKGHGFNQFSFSNGTSKAEPIFVRFLDFYSGELIGQPTEAFDQSDEEFSWRTPPALLDTKTIMEMSFNKQDWQKIIPKNQSHSYQYYNAPQVLQVVPSYGPVKSPNNEKTDLIGKNFNCPDPDCKDLFVRFGDPKNGIFVKGEKIAEDRVRCLVPKYTKPDVLQVEVTFNGEDYTHDNQTYGFFDPFILDVKPRLISKKGTTRVRLYGFGFVNATGTDLKSKFGTVENGELICPNRACIQLAEYIDKTTIETPTYPQQEVIYKNTNENIELNGLTVEASVYQNVFTENNIEIWYYEEPIYSDLSSTSSPRNLEKPIHVKTDFKWDKNDEDKLKKHSNFTCRFSSLDGKRVIHTKARMERYPLGGTEDKKPSHISCNSPKWSENEPAKLEFSVNGQDFSGEFTYTFLRPLDLHRIVPLAGPNQGSTKVKLIGTGFVTPKDDTQVKWGILETEKIAKDKVIDYIWNENDFIQHGMVEGSEVLFAYKKEAFNIEKKDSELHDGDSLKSYVANAPKLPNWNKTHGGPIYLSVGSNEKLNITNVTLGEDEHGNQITHITYFNKTQYIYSTSLVEYYYYKQPVVKKVEPKSGLTRGGTKIEISGAWFAYRPEYGVVPHCKIGDKVARAKFSSTVRIICPSPPNEDINQLFPLQVSLNGVDFVDSGFKFHYYEQPILYSMTPTCGPESGGTQIFISGAKFSNITDPQNFKCRFTSTERNVPPKYIPAYYQNQTTIMCSSPGGWGKGDQTKVQVTFNGADYSDNNFIFNYYNILRAVPRSGPSDGTGGPILIEGSGFPNNTEIFCSIDKTLYEPLEVKSDQIKCPLPKSKQGPDYFGNVDLAVVIDGNWHKFTGGFQYYPQVVIEDIYPKTGPAEGRGIIYFYGQNFRDDFQLADVGCKIGDSIGKAKIENQNTIRCTIEEMQLVDEGFSLPATVALNSYSWPETNQTFVPYDITGVYPNSGPYVGNTDILITGKGFTEELQEKAKCRFGVGADFAIVEAEILSYDKMICKSPPEFKLPATANSLLSVPIGVGFLEEEFQPWTETVHKYRLYNSPRIVYADPDEIEVGKMAEVYVFADEESEFFEPIPTGKSTLGQYGIECRFGRFGTSVGMYVNKTTVKCITPTVQDDPDDIWRETVRITVALNGQDFDEDSSDADFTFIGTGSTLVFWPYVLGTLLIGLLLVALIVACSAILNYVSVISIPNIQPKARQRKNRPHIIRDPYDQFTARGYTQGMLGRQAAPSQASMQQ